MQLGHFGVDAWIFQSSQHLIDSIGMRVFRQELLDLGIREWDGQLYGVWCVDVDRSVVWCGSLLYAAHYFLTFVAVIDVWCYYLFVSVIRVGDVEWVELEGSRVVGEVGETWVFVVVYLGFSVIVYSFFYLFNSGGGGCKTFKHHQQTLEILVETVETVGIVDIIVI